MVNEKLIAKVVISGVHHARSDLAGNSSDHITKIKRYNCRMKTYQEPTSKPMQDAIKRCGGNPTGDWKNDLQTALSVMMTEEQREMRLKIIKSRDIR